MTMGYGASELSLAVKSVNPSATDAEIADMVALAAGEGDEVTMSQFVMMMLFPKEAVAA